MPPIGNLLTICKLKALMNTPEGKSLSLAADLQDIQLTVEYLEQYQVVKVTAIGKLTLEGNDKLVAISLAACEKYNSKLILIDEKAVEVKMNLLSIYDLPQRNELLGASRDLRVALLYTPTKESRRLYQFYDDRAYISGIKHRIFVDEKEALHWLKQ